MEATGRVPYRPEATVPGNWLARRMVVRAAIAGLAVGLVLLAILVVYGTVSTQRASARIQQYNQVSAVWREAFSRLGAEDSALRQFLATGGTEYRRQPLVAAVGSVEPQLAWLERRGGPEETNRVRALRVGYAEYTKLLRDVLMVADQGGDVSGYGDLATLAFVSLRYEILLNIEHKQTETSRYLGTVNQRNVILRWVALSVGIVDLALFMTCSGVLIGYQRRIERVAAATRYQARHDSLTGLANRSYLTERACAAVDAARAGELVGMIFADIDGFKEINDALGHQCGDALLRQIAERLAVSPRRTDLVARLGGDEFAILLPGIGTVDEAVKIAERVMREIRAPVEVGGIKVDIRASIGVAAYPVDSDSADTLLCHADVAMYTAKRGRVAISVYNSDDDHSSPKRLGLLGEFRDGLAAGELVLHYQPKVDAATRNAIGVEALVRWQHPRRGLLGPDAFIPLIEQNDLIEQLTDEVLRIASKQVRTWLDNGIRLPVAVNVSARTLLNLEFPDQVAEILDGFGVPAELLTLELTESALVSDPIRTREVLLALRERGFRVSIDDFGTGYSSLRHLRELPVHEIKIDRSFVASMCSDIQNQVIVNAMVNMGRSLGMEIVAEGVEDEATFVALSRLGCHYIQGYLISKPLPALEITSWVRRQRGDRSGLAAISVAATRSATP